MPTIRQYFYKSVKNIILILFAIVFAFFLTLFIAWIFPANGPNLRMFFWFFYIKEIGLGILVLVMMFFLYKSYRIYKTEKSFPQEILKMTPSIVIWIGVFLYLSNLLYSLSDGTDCQHYNYSEKLNGGIKEFSGENYTINICGTGVSDNDFFGGVMDKVQLTVMDEKGEIVAKRRYKVFWGSDTDHQPLVIGKDSITYQDDENHEDHTITMPPTFIEWIRVRFPLFN